MVWKADHPVTPSSLVNSRASREKNCSTGPCTSPIRASSGVCTGALAYHGRPSAASRPAAAAMMKRTLERKPMVRMAGGSLSACRSSDSIPPPGIRVLT